MKKCNSCHINVNGNFNVCPLCQTELTGKPSKNVFPKIKQEEQGLLFKILLFISFTVAILFSFTEFMITHTFSITQYVLVGLLTNYLVIKYYVINYRKVLKMINRYFILITILLFIWYFVTRSLIITTYLIPSTCISIIFFNSLILLVLRRTYFFHFIRTMIIDCLFGLIPLLLVLFKLSTFPLLSYICALLSTIIFIGLLIFCYDNVIDELKKIFNY